MRHTSPFSNRALFPPFRLSLSLSLTNRRTRHRPARQKRRQRPNIVNMRSIVLLIDHLFLILKFLFLRSQKFRIRVTDRSPSRQTRRSEFRNRRIQHDQDFVFRFVDTMRGRRRSRSFPIRGVVAAAKLFGTVMPGATAITR